jgi:hypothetical protein
MLAGDTGIGGPIAKPRFTSFPRALNSLKPLNSAPPASICSPIKRVLGSSPHCSTNHSPHRRDFRGAAPNTPYWRLPPGQPGLWISRTVLYGRYGRSVSAPKNHFSWETETDLTRDWFESGRPALRWLFDLHVLWALDCSDFHAARSTDRKRADLNYRSCWIMSIKCSAHCQARVLPMCNALSISTG